MNARQESKLVEVIKGLDDQLSYIDGLRHDMRRTFPVESALMTNIATDLGELIEDLRETRRRCWHNHGVQEITK